MTNLLHSLGAKARDAADAMAQATALQKNAALDEMALALRTRSAEILVANQKDVAAAKTGGLSASMIDRLHLDEKRIHAIAESLAVIRDLPDPVGRRLDQVIRPNGLRIDKVSVPIGVIGIIFESRPNVAVDASALCLKSGNACILRGGSDSWHTVVVLTAIIQGALLNSGLPQGAVQTMPSPDRAYVGSLLSLDRYVDLVVPRGGKSLIARVREESTIPVLSHLEGICHTFIDSKADGTKAVAVSLNAKMRRTSVCGATECLLLHKDIVHTLGKDILIALRKAGCEIRVPPALRELIPDLRVVSENDYGHEFMDAVLAVAVVDDVQGAVSFVNHYGSQHTDAIITEDQAAADYFLNHVNSAIAIHNASTQFADGGEFGKGAEIGIATGKLHARGPVGLEELCIYQYRIHGDGQTRQL